MAVSGRSSIDAPAAVSFTVTDKQILGLEKSKPVSETATDGTDLTSRVEQ
jgi:hypothetical protein